MEYLLLDLSGSVIKIDMSKSFEKTLPELSVYSTEMLSGSVAFPIFIFLRA